MKLDYQSLIDEAMLGIVRKILQNAQNDPFNDIRSFYISFRTDHPLVKLSSKVKKDYPKEITIVLQHQYRDLIVLEDKFSVNIAFNSIPEVIEVPFESIIAFSDPSANFSLQFRSEEFEDDYEDILDQENFIESDKNLISMPIEPKNKKNSSEKKDRKEGEVISIDRFRKKP